MASGEGVQTPQQSGEKRSAWLDAGPALFGLGVMGLLPSALLFCLFFAGGPRGQPPLRALPWNHPLVLISGGGIVLSVVMFRVGLHLMREAARLSRLGGERT